MSNYNIPNRDKKNIVKQYFNNYHIRDFNNNNAIFLESKLSFRKDKTWLSPNIISYIFSDILQFKKPNLIIDKVYWFIPFYYKNIECSICFEKFGLRLYSNSSDIEVIYNDICENVFKVSKYLRNISNNSNSNTYIIPNRYVELLNMYFFFRKKAEENLKNIENVTIKNNNSTSSLNFLIENKYIFFYNYIAMINSYFSLSEHIMLFKYLFNFVINNIEIELLEIHKFLRLKWSDKFKKLFPLNVEENKCYYDELKFIKDRFRNTYAHGGFESKEKSFYQVAHSSLIMNIGYVKSSYNDSFLEIFGNSKDIFKSTIINFDKYDEYLKTIKAEYTICFLGKTLNFVTKKEVINELHKEIELGLSSFNDFLQLKFDYACNLLNAEN